MATLSTSSRLTLVEVAKRKAPDGSMIPIADALVEENPIVKEAPFFEANDTFSNKTTRWSQEPSGTWRKINKGVATESAKSTELIDTIGILETRSEIDTEVVAAYANPQKGRSDEAMRFVKGLGKTMATTIIYGDASTVPEKFTGVAPRVDAYADTMVANGGGSGGDTTSVYIITWGKDDAYMIYPKGSKAGLDHMDLGVESVLDRDGTNKFTAYVDKFTWKAGFVLRNQRAIGRICNIETTGTSNIFDEDYLIDVLVQMDIHSGTRIYVNRTIMAQMWKRLKDKNNVHFEKGDGLDAGGPPITFDGIPIKRCDKIVNTETALTS